VKSSVVARNYAEALLAIAEQAQSVEKIGELLDAVAGAMASDDTLKAVMMSPRVRKSQKQAMLAKALGSLAPPTFIKFLQAVVQRGRQDLFSEMNEAYQLLADKHFNRVHASVVTAREADAALRQAITERLTKAMGKTVLPHFRADASLIGGVIVRLGDRVLDGSIRRRIQTLRTRMLNSGR
jgi:F-type H+-transporting ATPase subunit delta